MAVNVSRELTTVRKRDPIYVEGNVQESKLIKRVEPVYPDHAKQVRVAGNIYLEVTVDEQGNVSNVRVIRGHPILDEEALRAVRQWKYKPTLLGGKPVAVIAPVVVKNLPDSQLGKPLGIAASQPLGDTKFTAESANNEESKRAAWQYWYKYWSKCESTYQTYGIIGNYPAERQRSAYGQVADTRARLLQEPLSQASKNVRITLAPTKLENPDGLNRLIWNGSVTYEYAVRTYSQTAGTWYDAQWRPVSIKYNLKVWEGGNLTLHFQEVILGKVYSRWIAIRRFRRASEKQNDAPLCIQATPG